MKLGRAVRIQYSPITLNLAQKKFAQVYVFEFLKSQQLQVINKNKLVGKKIKKIKKLKKVEIEKKTCQIEASKNNLENLFILIFIAI